jgi:hypothetical protein
MGLFAEWQPKYAEHRISTFPVRSDGKKPAVAGYLRVGSDVSQQLALKFAASDAFGFALKRNRITVLDVDEPSERTLADALDRHGPTPFVVRSGSGNFQAWYRHNGERRRVRPWPGKPIDILGDGYVIAPPSRGSRGRYEIIEGSLDDLDHLPTIRGLDAPAEAKPIRGDRIGQGERNRLLWRYCMKQATYCDDLDALLDVARSFAEERIDRLDGHPFTDAEILGTAQQAWRYTERGENWFGKGGMVAVEHAIVDLLAASHPDAFALFSILKCRHWGRAEFILASSMAASLGWTLKRFKEARGSLVECGLIRCLHPGGRGRNDPPIYAWGKGCDFVPQ